jgi:hypothetical protein
MDFVSTICFLVLYYIRPYEHTWGLVYQLVGWMKPIQLVTIFGMVAMVRRPGGIRKSDFLQTPHDWQMIILFAFIVVTSGRLQHTFMALLPVFVFYLIIVQSLRTQERLEKFLACWVGMIVLLSAMALGVYVGFDPVGGRDVVEGPMKGRLIFNTSIFNNANALGHSIVLGIPLVYYLLIWKRPVFVMIPGAFVLMLPCLCVYNTQSKGSFLAGAVILLVSMLFKRHWVVQAMIMMMVVAVGVTLVKKLPRMENFSKQEAGIQGRQIAFEFGYSLTTEQAKWVGVGYKNYLSTMIDQLGVGVSTHSSYNEIGSTHGQIGLCLYLGLMYLSLRVLLFAKPRTVGEDRVQRLLLVFVLSFGISSWVVDWAYRATFFFIAATVAAFHRLLLKDVVTLTGQVSSSLPPLPSNDATQEDQDDGQPQNPGIRWRKIGILDIFLMVTFLKIGLFCWHQMILAEF